MSFVSVALYKKAVELAISEGLPPELLKSHNIALNSPESPKYIPLDLHHEIYELAYENLKPGFPLRLGAIMSADDYGTLGLSWKTAWKAIDVFERCRRYMILITDRGIFDVENDGLTTHFTIERDNHRLGQTLSNEATFGMCTNVLSSISKVKINPTLVRFKHKAHRNIEPYQNYFQCEVKFGEKLNAISYLTKDLLTPTVKADKSIHQFLIERMEEEKKAILVNSNQIVSDVEKLIKETLPSGIPSIVEVSEYMGMSNRTLTRRLSESGFSFRDLIRKTQELISKELLQNTNRNIAEIAFETGFSEQSAFNRAFKRWTGYSPVEFRKM